MTTALPSAACFIYDKFALGDYDFGSGVGSPFPALIDNPLAYDKLFTDIGPRNLGGGVYKLEWANLWHTSGQTASLVTLADQYEIIKAQGKEILHYLGGIHYPQNNSFWDPMLYPRRGSAARSILLGCGGSGSVGLNIEAFLMRMIGVFKRNGTWLCKFVVDGTGLVTAEKLSEIEVVHALERLGATVVIEAYSVAPYVFTGYPSVTLSGTAIDNAATFDGLSSNNAVIVTDVEDEPAIAGWRASNRDIYGADSFVVPGPWAGFGAYGG